ncbi:LCP family protein [Leifsonia sp. Leaf336]|uniref:LCP family protein n=1 Tax=Leifsonia sp. Leaf336 TaxID=1736341 RepID=UPI0009E89AFE|nr:LCP family protein [Leifsonia sp. Leaf336]
MAIHSMRIHPHDRNGRWLRAAIVLASVVLLFAGTAFGVAAFYAGSVASTFDSHVTRLPNALPTAVPRPPVSSTGAMNILLLGSDSRGDPTAVGTTALSNQRSDTMMLVHIDADRRDVYVMSIMRDLWVPIPGNGTAKINAALAWGGTPLTVQTVEQLLQVRIDHVAILDFAGLKDITNAIGGVDVDSPVAFTTVKSPHYTFVKGMNHLDGDEALAFARERYAFPEADYQRVADQQALLAGFATTLIHRSVLTDPSALLAFARSTGSAVSVDSSFDLPSMLALAASMRISGASGIHTFTLPTAGTGTSADGQSIVNVDPAALARVRTALATDTLSQFAPGP